LSKKIVTGLVLAFAALTFLAAISAALPENPWSGPYSNQNDESWLNPWEEYSWQDQWPSGWNTPYDPTTTTGYEPSVMYSSDGHPNTGPDSSMQPTSTPSASTGSPISYLDDGESLSESELKSLPDSSRLMASSGGWDSTQTYSGGSDGLSAYYGGGQVDYRGYYGGTKSYYGGYYSYGGLQQWIYYCGRWSYGPAALWLGQQTNTIIRNDQYQRIWSYERYPNGYEDWQYWGYWYPGYHHAWFGADARGWHQIAVWGSRTGWSNSIWVYVW